MFSKIYEKSKKFIKENYKDLIFFLILCIFVFYPVDYYVTIGGGTLNIEKRVEIKGSYKSRGSMSFAYVRQLNGTLSTWLLSYIIPSWESTSVNDYRISKDENISDISFRDDLSLKTGNMNAIKNAYELAGKKIEIVDSHFYITFVEKHNSKELKVGDEILKVDGVEVKSLDDIGKKIKSMNDKDKVNLQIKRKNKIIEKSVEVYEENGTLLVGIVLERLDDYKTDPEVKLKFKSSESGPSGGMMLTLDIYNKLTKYDITNGKKIVGTGTVEYDGTVGEIGGVKYKLMGAVSSRADIFLVPNGSNYEEAVKYAKKKNYKIKIIAVNNIKDALEKLKKNT